MRRHSWQPWQLWRALVCGQCTCSWSSGFTSQMSFQLGIWVYVKGFRNCISWKHCLLFLRWQRLLHPGDPSDPWEPGICGVLMTIAGPFLHLLESITMWHSKVPVWVLIVATLELILSFRRWNELQIGWWSDAWVIGVLSFMELHSSLLMPSACMFACIRGKAKMKWSLPLKFAAAWMRILLNSLYF